MTGVQHVALEMAAEDVESCGVFFGLLGFAAVPVPAALRDRSVWFERDGTQVHLLLSDAPVVPPAGHCAVVVSDYAATVGALRDAGFTVEARAEHWGSPRSFAAAPGGHRVELMAFAPAASSAARATGASEHPDPGSPRR